MGRSNDPTNRRKMQFSFEIGMWISCHVCFMTTQKTKHTKHIPFCAFICYLPDFVIGVVAYVSSS
jgi:hypothetical protein